MGLTESTVKLARALYWCKPCLEDRHGDCEAPCGCTLHPHAGKVNEQLERYGHAGVTFTDEQKQQIQASIEEKAMNEQPKHDGNLDVFADSYHYLRVDWHGNGIEIKDATYQFVELSSKQALSLLAWLQQEREKLERLAEEKP